MNVGGLGEVIHGWLWGGGGHPAQDRLVRSTVTDPAPPPGRLSTRPQVSKYVVLNLKPGPAPLGAARPLVGLASKFS